MEKIFYHYSGEADLTIDNINMSKGIGFKPGGIWLSDDSNDFGWADWCKAEDFRIGQLRYKYQVKVDMKSVLLLDNYNKFSYFLNKYSVPSEFSLERINWWDVALDYRGISFTPYHREWCWMREDDFSLTTWYSTIDCDSACIWNKSAITHFGKAELTGIR